MLLDIMADNVCETLIRQVNYLLNKVQFIEWTVEGNRNVVAILNSGEVIRGKAMVFEENVLQIKLHEHEVLREIKVNEITDYFNIKKPLNPW